MEIEKIFSEIDTDERIYSVLMDEEEYALYSEFQERMYFNFWSNVGGAINGVKKAAAKAGEAVKNSDLIRKAKIAGAGHGQYIDDAAKKAELAAKAAAKEKIVGGFNKAKNAVREAGQAVAEKAKAGANAVKSGVESGVNAAREAGVRTANAAKSGAEAIRTGVNNAVESTSNAARQAGRNLAAEGHHARRGMRDSLIKKLQGIH